MSILKLNTLILLFILSYSTLLQANTGVAFVHGTGSHTDALNKYWKSHFINSVMSGNNNPHVIINCQLDQYMWRPGAGGCVAEQISQFIKTNHIRSLYVITHSNGANVIRWILSNPTWDKRYPAIINTIKNVTAIAPSSGGTPLADAVINGNVFEKILGWILGYANDAVRQQQVSAMQYYNHYWLLGGRGRPALPQSFKSIIGTDVDSAFWDRDSYCGGYASQVALEVTQEWLSKCSDGFLDCSSQSAAGHVWFYDQERTAGKEPLSHQQSRRSCFGLDGQLRNDIQRINQL